jgi:hypothetical protein
MPFYDVDQYIYWHEMATYAHSGFNGGYYGVNELISPLKGFGPHGVGIITIYGIMYRLMPWFGFAAIPVFNLILLTAALAAYIWIMRPKLGESLAVTLAITLHPMVFLYLPTSFQEGFHYAAAVLLAMVFIRLIEKRDEPDMSAFRLMAGLFLLMLCFVRYTWALCFLPYFYIILSKKRWRLPLAFVMTVVVSLGIVKFFNLFVPAWYTSLNSGLNPTGTLLTDKIGFVLKQALSNIHTLLNFADNKAATAVLAGILFFLLLAALVTFRSSSWKRGQVSSGSVILLLVAGNIAGLMGIFILTWTGSGSHLVRLLSANYILCFIVTFHFFPRRMFHLLVAYNAALFPLYMGIFQVYHLPGYINDEPRFTIQTFAKQVGPYLEASSVSSPWDKTIFVDVPERGLAYLGIPAGFGIQTGVGKTNDAPRFSRFALLSTPPTDTDGRRWAPIQATDIGTLYINSPSPAPGRAPTP